MCFLRKNERAFLNGVSIGKNSVRVLRPRGDGNYNLDTPQPN